MAAERAQMVAFNMEKLSENQIAKSQRFVVSAVHHAMQKS